MKSSRLILPTLAILLAVTAYGEVITGPAQVLDKPYGKVLFTINDGVKVDCAPVDNLHQEIGFVGVITNESLWGADRMKKRQGIYSLDGERIGETVRQVTLPLGKVPRGQGRFAAVFTGYVSVRNVDKSSTVESALEPIIDHKARPLTFVDLRPHLIKFGYKQGPSRDGFRTYICHESWVNGTEDAARVVLVFKANRFVAVLGNRPIHFLAYAPIYVRDGYTLTYLETIGQPAADALEHGLAREVLRS